MLQKIRNPTSRKKTGEKLTREQRVQVLYQLSKMVKATYGTFSSPSNEEQRMGEDITAHADTMDAMGEDDEVPKVTRTPPAMTSLS